MGGQRKNTLVRHKLHNGQYETVAAEAKWANALVQIIPVL